MASVAATKMTVEAETIQQHQHHAHQPILQHQHQPDAPQAAPQQQLFPISNRVVINSPTISNRCSLSSSPSISSTIRKITNSPLSNITKRGVISSSSPTISNNINLTSNPPISISNNKPTKNSLTGNSSKPTASPSFNISHSKPTNKPLTYNQPNHLISMWDNKPSIYAKLRTKK